MTADNNPTDSAPRPGRGRPKGSPNKRAVNPPRRKFAFSLPAEEGAELLAKAQAEGISPYAWIVETIRRALRGRRRRRDDDK